MFGAAQRHADQKMSRRNSAVPELVSTISCPRLSRPRPHQGQRGPIPAA